ncbi:MAG: hypothetical protein AB1767_04185 [Bacillota bacterium]
MEVLREARKWGAIGMNIQGWVTRRPDARHEARHRRDQGALAFQR